MCLDFALIKFTHSGPDALVYGLYCFYVKDLILSTEDFQSPLFVAPLSLDFKN